MFEAARQGLAAEISLTHALRCMPERAAELEPLWNEVGRTSLATRGASSPYTLYVRAKSASDRDQPAAGHKAMTIGIEQFRDPGELRLDHMLTQPFREADRSYALGRREGAAAPGGEK